MVLVFKSHRTHEFLVRNIMNTRKKSEKNLKNSKQTSTNSSKSFNKIETTLMISMFIMCFFSLILGILSLIFPHSDLLDIAFPIFTIICVIEILINACTRIYNLKIGRKKIQEIMEQSAIASESRNIFFANISHEFRTPINIIQGMNEMIIRESDSKNITEYAKNAFIASKNLERIVNNLIIYSRITTGYLSPINYQFDLLEYLTSYCNMIHTESKRNNFTFNYYVNPSISRDTIGDNSLLGQLLDNLVTIPLQNDHPPTINITFSWDSTSAENGSLSIHMENQGNFVAEDILLNLNNSNLNSRINNSQGVNFNLAIIKCILDVMEGSFTISNNPDKGSDFYITIPFKTKENQSLTDNITSRNNNSPSFSAPDARILVVDDHCLNIEVITTLLKRTEIQIDSATSGKDALDLLKNNTYHMLLIDYMMPEMNGIELLTRIKEDFPSVYENVPILALSASTNTEIRDKIKSAGFNDFVPKPVEGMILELIIKENLPEILINESNTNTDTHIFTPEIISGFEELLIKYDINLSEGLKYMSGDLVQYHMVAELISKNYEKNLKNIQQLYKNGNYKDFGIAVHALKGNARFIGATTLYNISMSLENRAAKFEEDFINLSLPLLYYQWEKTIGGIRLFLKEFKQINYDTNDKSYDVEIDENYIDQLMEYTDNFQPEPALKLIEQILKHDITSDNIQKLRMAAQYLEELEYDDAMTIFKEMI